MSTLQIYKAVKIIDAPLEEVYDYLSKMKHIRNWSDLVVDYTFIEGEPAEYCYAGQKVHVVQKVRGKTFSADGWVEELRAPFFIDVRTKDAVGTSIAQYHLKPIQNQTEIQVNVSAELLKWYHSLIYRLAKSGLKKLYNKEFNRLNDYAIQMSHR